MSTIWVAVLYPVTVIALVALVNPDAETVTVVAVPAVLPINVLVATPLAGIALPVPDSVEEPPEVAKLIVLVAVVTVLLFASWMVAVNCSRSPAAIVALDGVSTILLAAPGVTVSVAVPLVSPDAAAVIVVAVPATTPVNVLVATPDAAVAFPVPVTVEVPPAAAKLIVLVAVVTVLP